MKTETTPHRIIRLPEVKNLTGLSRASIYAKMKSPEAGFPRPISLGTKSVGWIEQEVADWIAQRIAQSRQG